MFCFCESDEKRQNGCRLKFPMHRFRDSPKSEAALQQSYRLFKVRDKRTALEALNWRKNETKCSVLFLFQLGKAKENAKLLTCCLNISSISKLSSPTTRLAHDKTRFSKEW